MQADSLNLSKGDIAGGKIASVSGTIVLRSIMGPVMDVFGARKGMFVLMAVCTPGIIGMMFATNAAGEYACAHPGQQHNKQPIHTVSLSSDRFHRLPLPDRLLAGRGRLLADLVRANVLRERHRRRQCHCSRLGQPGRRHHQPGE